MAGDVHSAAIIASMKQLSLLIIAALLAGCAPPPPRAAPPSSASASQTQSATAAPSLSQVATVPPAPIVAVPAASSASPAQPRDLTALSRAFGRTALAATPAAAPTAAQAPARAAIGDEATFWVLDRTSNTNVQIRATLRYAGPVTRFYVDTALALDQAAIDAAGDRFEQQILPRDTQLFGQLDALPVGDGTIAVLHTALSGIGGYFSPSDSVPRAINRFSNERAMVVIGVNSFPLGTDSYFATLAHELKHLIAGSRRAPLPSWQAEGMAGLAQDLNGYVDQGSATAYLEQPDLPLAEWGGDGPTLSRHYGQSRLFFRYLTERIGEGGLPELIDRVAGDDPALLAAIAARRDPRFSSFDDLFAAWALANLLADPVLDGGRYSYALLPQPAAAAPPAVGQTDVGQYGADYVTLPPGARLTFRGATEVAPFPVQPADGRRMWWSGRGDERVATLTRAIDLRGRTTATLRFAAWYELERGYDYAFVTVSRDGGATWATLPGSATTRDDPQGLSYGDGLTGVSGEQTADIGDARRGRWVDETFDLTPYAGAQIQLRLWAITDAAIDGGGLLLDRIAIPEIGFADGAERDVGAWDAAGFSRVGGSVPQTWALRLVRRRGAVTIIETIAPAADGTAAIATAAGETATMLVFGTVWGVATPASYRIDAAPGG